MLYSNYSYRRNSGYIALMATIIMSAVLLFITIEVGQFGWYARFAILEIETKEQSFSLARSCGTEALQQVLVDPFYNGNSHKITGIGQCFIYPILRNYPSEDMVTIKVRGEVMSTISNLILTYSVGKINLQPVPSEVVVGVHDTAVELISLKEVANIP